MSIDKVGYLNLVFSEPVVPLTNLAKLKKKEVTIGNEKKPNMEIVAIPYEDQDAGELDFSWTPIKANETTLQIRLEFKQPAYVSSNIVEPNQISVKIWGQNLFIRQADGYSVPQSSSTSHELPQLIEESLAQNVEEFASGIS